MPVFINDLLTHSTSPNELDYSCYNEVQTLHHTDRKKDFNMNSTSSAIR
jgi:hypothetical protein